ncbi:hypothetical protein HC251_15975 [Iamia sp. SCSIO 61187]|uniref:hypothetical protein n=1 Tax=Iamia sp. SCSIO 61187 TaxID=2722752 RepID=UPI001C633438|nr:hypothetical protein [Iamia sp. SCSIO 61187]QYG93774.1 hypothetical protein HC251_15975 [Iamia sp. SCSIO 61187]
MDPAGPRPPDIAFDHAAAQAAILALDRAQAVAADTSSARATAARRASAEFRGAYADDFTAADTDLGAATLDAVIALTSLRQAIAGAMAAARTAQDTRAAEQRSWDAAHRPGLPRRVA